MAIEISIERVKLVRESSHIYSFSPREVSSPDVVADVINEVLDLNHEPQEIVCEIMLNTKNHIVGVMEVTRGTLDSSLVHPREVFRGAILHNAASIILCHNHPSGDSAPSREDMKVTERIKQAGKVLGIDLLDHVIIGNGECTSIREEGLL